jgi:hypothetical protein
MEKLAFKIIEIGQAAISHWHNSNAHNSMNEKRICHPVWLNRDDRDHILIVTVEIDFGGRRAIRASLFLMVHKSQSTWSVVAFYIFLFHFCFAPVFRVSIFPWLFRILLQPSLIELNLTGEPSSSYAPTRSGGESDPLHGGILIHAWLYFYRWSRRSLRAMKISHREYSLEPIFDMEPRWVPYDCKHECFLWTSVVAFVANSFLTNANIGRGSDRRNKQNSSPVIKGNQSSFLTAPS